MGGGVAGQGKAKICLAGRRRGRVCRSAIGRMIRSGSVGMTASRPLPFLAEVGGLARSAVQRALAARRCSVREETLGCEIVPVGGVYPRGESCERGPRPRSRKMRSSDTENLPGVGFQVPGGPACKLLETRQLGVARRGPHVFPLITAPPSASMRFALCLWRAALCTFHLHDAFHRVLAGPLRAAPI